MESPGDEEDDSSPQQACYAAAGYKGVKFTLPAVETFLQNIESGGNPEELQVLYKTWTASTKVT